MSTSTLITDWMGSGTAADKPSSPPIASSGVAFYYATDTTTLYMWDTNASTWKQVSLGSGSGGLWSNELSSVPTSSGTGLTTWGNQNSATIADTTAGVLLTAANASANDSWSIRYKTAPSTPYSITALISFLPWTVSSSGDYNVGIGFYDGTKTVVLRNLLHNNGAAFPLVSEYSGLTTWNSNVWSGSTLSQTMLWMKIKDDGTNLLFYLSADGYNFTQVYSQGRTSYLTGPTDIFFGAAANGGTLPATLMSWTVGT